MSGKGAKPTQQMRVPKLSRQQDNCTEQPRNESREAILASLMGLSGRLLSAGKARHLTERDREDRSILSLLTIPQIDIGQRADERTRTAFMLITRL